MDISQTFGGNAWDPEADEDYQAILRQVRTVPPACFGKLHSTPAHAAEWNGHARWSVACPCGNATGAVLGYPLDEVSGDSSLKDLFVGPLAFRCSTCDAVTEMFDSAAHGYNAEISKESGVPETGGYRGEGPRAAAACPGCGKSAYRVVGDFSHSHFDHIEDEPDLLDSAQDYFDGFGCVATCASCGHEWWVASFELA